MVSPQQCNAGFPSTFLGVVFTSTWEGGWPATGAVPAGSGGRCSPTTLLPGWGWVAHQQGGCPAAGGARQAHWCRRWRRPADPSWQGRPRKLWIPLNISGGQRSGGQGRIILVWCQKLLSALPSPFHPWPLVPLVPLLSGASTCFRLVAHLRFPDCFCLG